jgi:fibronectin-binding autotransporter adhesin
LPKSVTFNNLNQNYLIQGTHAIAGSATLAVNGGGYVAISNSNSYTGGTTLSNGTLSFANGALGTTGNITFAGSNADLQWNGNNTQDVSGRLAISNAATATIDTQGNNVTFANGFGGGGSGSLVYVGSGTLTMTGPNTFIGSTTISNGTLQLGNGTLGNDGSLASPAINDNSALVYNLAGSQTYSGAIGGNGSLHKSGSGTLTLAGNNSYSGATTVNGGVLSVASAAILPAASPLTLSNGGALNMTAGMTLANNVTVSSGQAGTLRLVGAVTATLAGDYSGTAGTLTLDESTGSGYSGFSIGSANGPALGSTVLVLGTTSSNNVQVSDNNSAYQAFFANSKVTIVASGTGFTYLQCGNSSANDFQVGALDGGNATTKIGFDNRTGEVTINGTANGNYSGYIYNGDGSVGPLSLVMSGTATQILSGQNLYTGSTTINSGVLQAIDGIGLPSGSNLVFNGDLAVNGNGAVFQSSGTFSRALGTGAGQVQWFADGGFSANGGPLTVSMNNNLSDPLQWGITPDFIGSAAVLTFGSPTANSQVKFTDTIDLFGGNRQIDVAAGTGGDSALISGDIIDSFGGASLTKTGAGTLILSGSNSYQGGTIVDAGTLIVDSPASLADGSSLTVGQGAAAIFSPAGPSPAGVAAVPEPGTIMLLLTALWTAVGHRVLMVGYRFSKRPVLRKNLPLTRIQDIS